MVLICALLSVVLTAVLSQSKHEVRWLPCEFIDEHVVIVEELVLGKKMNISETKYQHRNAGLQFGNPGDRPVRSDLITFLATASKVDMRRYMKEGLDTLQCEVRRYRTGASPVRWPSMGAQEHDNWFTCTLRHTEGHFVITSFLRHSPSVPDVMQPNLQWSPIADRDIITTTAVVLMFSNTPSVVVALMEEQTLNCEFAVDHKAAHLTVEWYLQRNGYPTTKLFSYASHTGQSEGSGVSVKAIAKGDASLKIPLTRETSEGTYVCSLHIPPLSGSCNIPVEIKEPPFVSLNVNSEVSLSEGELQRVDCEAKGYYPLDVHMEWVRKSVNPGTSHVFEVLNTLGIVKFPSHRHNPDGTYSSIAYFLLRPTLQDSGYLYTCRVSHKALQMPIRKSFTLSVTRKDSYIWYLPPLLSIIGILALLLSRRHAGKA
ncbi:tapasin-related protein-like isoform X2 [Sardina pilchardus]|uniref:tapasin-related protein-like isoform X2 n=1 Tax=Sardina pilchardus TaxID=27697 RepID=UPI002E0E1970